MSLIQKAEALARADAAAPGTSEEKLDKLLNGLGSLNTRMDADETARKDGEGKVMAALDSFAKRLDACEADNKARKDADEKEEKEKERADAAAKKDADEKKEKEEKERADAEAKAKEEEKGRADAAARAASPDVQAQLKALEARIPVALSDADRKLFTDAQVRAERVAQAFGDSEGAPRWVNGESLSDYQRRLLGKYKPHSVHWKDKDLMKVDASVLDIAESQIYADAMTAASAPTTVVAGTLREHTTTDITGRRITRFIGDPEVTWSPFKQAIRGVTGMHGGARTNVAQA